jgi:predicted Zn-dependent peptidase
VRSVVQAKLLSFVVVCLLLSGCASTRPAWELPAPPAREVPIVAEGALVEKRLPNGLHVMLLRDRSRPMISLGLELKRGAAIDPAGKEGLAVLMGEVMQRGAGDRDALELARDVEALGADLGVSVGWDSTGVGASGLSRDTDALLGFVADVALRPRFEVGEVERARSEQLAGLAASLDNPRNVLGWQLQRTLFGSHRYGVPSAGLPETVEPLGVADVRAMHGRLFHPNNAIFHAAGDFDPETLLAKIEAAFGNWRPGPVAKPVAAPPRTTPPAPRIMVVDRPEMVQVQMALAHEGLQRSDERRIPASLLNNVLGGSGFSSRLTVRLRSNEGLTYSIRSGFVLRRRPGRFGVSTFTRADQARPAIESILEELEAIRGERPVSEEELRNAKAFSLGHFALGLETSGAVLGRLVNLAVYGLPEDSLDTYRARVNGVTLEQVHGLAESLLHPDRLAVVIVGPAEALVPRLDGLGEVEVVTW